MFIEKIFVLLLKITSNLKPQTGMAIARMLATFAILLNTRLRKTTERNLMLCFHELSDKDLYDLVRDSLANSFYLFFEYAYTSPENACMLLKVGCIQFSFFCNIGCIKFRNAFKRLESGFSTKTSWTHPALHVLQNWMHVLHFCL